VSYYRQWQWLLATASDCHCVYRLLLHVYMHVLGASAIHTRVQPLMCLLSYHTGPLWALSEPVGPLTAGRAGCVGNFQICVICTRSIPIMNNIPRDSTQTCSRNHRCGLAVQLRPLTSPKNPLKAVGYASQKGLLRVFTRFRGPKSVGIR
jgi:hypothetical protein